ncbi:ephrin type-B receptor 1-B-like [Oculina patagonica]
MTGIIQQFWTTIFTTLMFAALASSSQVVLENTKNHGWYWIKKEPSGVGWGRQTESQGKPLRYTVCAVTLPQSDPIPQPNNWLISDQIAVSKANRIDITVDYYITSCSNYPPNNGGPYCVDMFDLYVNQSNQFIADPSRYPNPLNSTASYEKVAEIKQAINIRTSETINVLIKGKHVLLAFHNYGGCNVLYSVKVTYNVCPDEILSNSLVTLPRTVAPANDSDPMQVEGYCGKDTVQVPGSLYVHCKDNGEWNTSGLEGRCICKEDMQNVEGVCQACPDGKYNDQMGLNCTVLPTIPRSINVKFVNQSAVELRWLPPAITGDQTDVFYDVDCRKPCTSNDDNDCVDEGCGGDVTYVPYKEGLNVTYVLVTNLSSFTNYTFKIYAKNRVSEVAKRRHGVEGNFMTITVTTNGSVPGKLKVFAEQPEEAVVVSWILKHKNGVIKDYHVTYIREDDFSDSKTLKTQNTELQFEDLMAGKTYEFQVFAVNDFGKGPTGVKTFRLKNADESKALKAIAIGGGGGGLLLILVILVVIFVFRRNNVFNIYSSRRRNVDKAYMRSIERGNQLQPTSSTNQRRYIDPGNYLDLMELISTFTKELDRSDTKLEGIIGQGEFADVYKGTLKTREGKQVVAVKVLRPGSSEKNQKDFLSEASIMCQFNHPNVIRLIGVVTQSSPMMILAEFLESGSLDYFLQERDGQLTSLQLIGMARGVACGMVYLSNMNFIHRDLAARNVLVGENMLCKVSDFGLSRELHADDDEQDLAEYETQGGKIPVRWTAPEALQYRTFSTASDVWSFGILVWEIMSYCNRPYWDWNNYDVIKRVKSGYRLPPPQGCPNVVYCLMMECWDKDKSKRPTFSEIVSRFDELIRSPELLKDTLSASLPSASPKVDLPEFKSLEDWLLYINMEKYSEIFQTAGIENLNKVTMLEDKDLSEIGIKLIGHRNKMNKSIKAMKSQYYNKGMDNEEA